MYVRNAARLTLSYNFCKITKNIRNRQKKVMTLERQTMPSVSSPLWTVVFLCPSRLLHRLVANNQSTIQNYEKNPRPDNFFYKNRITNKIQRRFFCYWTKISL